MNWIRFAVIVLLTGRGFLALAQNNCGFGYELIVNALEAMQNSLQSTTAKMNDFIESQSELKQRVNQIIENQSKLERQLNNSMGGLTKLENLFANDRMAVDIRIDQLKDAIAAEPKCSEFGGKGIYPLKIPHSYAFRALCENDWIVIHRRFNGSLNFNRSWSQYRDGFGNLQDEFWLGLDRMHRITRTGSYELLVVLKSFGGVVKTAKFGRFKIGSESEEYQLHLGEFIEGNAGDSLSNQNSMKFSTPDRDNDKATGSCAASYQSGWWFNSCYTSNLNGLYKEGKVDDTMSWYQFNGSRECLKEASMMIRAKETKN